MEKEKIDVEGLLSRGQSVEIYPTGYSMYPLVIPGRDRAVLAPFIRQRDQVRKGDVLLFRRKHSILVLHRVCRVGADGVYFVGDNQKEVEGPIPYNQIVGKATAFVRKGRRISVGRPMYRILTGLWLWLRPIRPLFWTITKGARTLLGRNNHEN